MTAGGRTDTPSAPIAQLVLSRRAFLHGTAAASVATVLASCSPNPVPSPSAVPTPTPLPTQAPPNGYFNALAELRTAVRGSADHLVAEADRLVEAGDADAIVAFVIGSIATYPSGAVSTGDPVSGRRWGSRATLRGGAGTPREKADLLAELLTRAGMVGTVVEVEIDPAAAAHLYESAPARPSFTPTVDDARLALLREIMGLPPTMEPPPSLDDDGLAGAALADDLIGKFEPAPKGNSFEIRTPRTVAMVRVERAGQTLLADPIGIGGAAGLAPIGTRVVTGAPDASKTLEVHVTVEAARADAPDRPFILVDGTWRAEDVVGRRLFVAFPPPAESLEELLVVKPRDVGIVIPTLAIRGQDLDAAATRELVVVGTPITLGGDLVDPDGPDGQVLVGGEPIGPAGPADPATVAAVRELSVEAIAAGFPTMSLAVRALDASGVPVEGLPATAFRVVDQDVPVGFVLEQSTAPAPRILILLDDSSSIPDAFRGAGAATLARRVAERLRDADPDATFRIAMVSLDEAAPSGGWTSDIDALVAQATAGSGYGSELWSSLVDAAKLGATAIVMITDGKATDASGVALTVPPPGLVAQVRAGPKTVLIGVGPVDTAGLDALGTAGRLGAFAVDDQDAAVNAVVTALTDTPVASYRFRYQAPSDEPASRTVRVELPTTTVVGTATYAVPALDQRSRPAGLSGLFLTVRVGETEARRVLAGIDINDRRAVADRATLERVRRALFDTTALEFEAAAPPPSIVIDELYTAILALQPLFEATDDAERLSALAALATGGPTIEPATLGVLTIALPETGGATLTYEAGLRVVLHREQVVPTGGGRAIQRRAVDLLPSARFTTADADPVTAFATTARRTARLAIAESVAFPNSTLAALRGEELTPVGYSIFDILDPVDRVLARAMDDAVSPWRDVRPRMLIPGDGTPTAAWVFDGRTGSMVGLLADGSGGGSEEQDIEDTFSRAESLLDRAGLASDLASAAGLGGFSFAGGVWISLEKTKIQKLKAATLMLASLRAPSEDITDLSDLGCTLATGAAFEAGGRVLGGIIGELGGRAAAAGSAGAGMLGLTC